MWRAIIFPISVWRRRRASEAYAQALAASRKAWAVGDTRTIHTAQRALVEAQAERLRVGA